MLKLQCDVEAIAVSFTVFRKASNSLKRPQWENPRFCEPSRSAGVAVFRSRFFKNLAILIGFNAVSEGGIFFVDEAVKTGRLNGNLNAVV